MATREIAEWEAVDASNDFTAEEGGWTEGMPRSDVNDAARADMGALRRFYEDTEWLDLTIGATVSQQSSTVARVLTKAGVTYFVAGRRLKFTGGSPDPFYATVVSVQDANGDIDVTIDNPSVTGGLPSGVTGVTLHSTPTIGPLAWAGQPFKTVPILDDVGLAAALDGYSGTIYLEPGETYVINTKITISESHVRIIGNGAILQAIDDLDSEIMEITGANVYLEGVVFDGQESGQDTPTDNLGLLKITGESVRVIGCAFTDSWGHGITIENTQNGILVEACIFFGVGQDGINIVDVNNNINLIYISHCQFIDISDRISGFAGINFAGRVSIDDCQFNELNHASFLQYGVLCHQKDSASPDDESGRESTIVGCRFDGTGLNATGILVNSRDMAISTCAFNLTGNSSFGVDVSQPFGGAEVERVAITGSVFRECGTGVRLRDDATHCTITGCTFESCTTSISINADSSSVGNCTMNGGTNGILVLGSCADTIIGHCTITVMSADGINVAAGASLIGISHNVFTGNGTDIDDSGTGTNIFLIGGDVENSYVQLAVFETETDIDNEHLMGSLIVAADLNADGSKFYVLNFQIDASAPGVNGTALEWRIRVGPNSVVDPTIDTQVWRGLDISLNNSRSFIVCGLRVIPAFGDDVYFTVKRISGGGVPTNARVEGDDSTFGRSWMRLYAEILSV